MGCFKYKILVSQNADLNSEALGFTPGRGSIVSTNQVITVANCFL